VERGELEGSGSIFDVTMNDAYPEGGQPLFSPDPAQLGATHTFEDRPLFPRGI
jgi:hypothetical protein